LRETSAALFYAPRRTNAASGSNGRVTSKVDATTNTILTYAYDANNRLTTRWSLGKGNTGYGYDAVGNLTSVTYQVNPSLSFTYNAMNWMTGMSDGVGSSTFTYDQAGHLASETGPWSSDTIAYTYLNRQRASLNLQNPSASSWAQSYAYDGANRLKSITSPAGTFGYSYNSGLAGTGDASALVQKIALPNGAYITNVYDANGRMATNCLYNSSATALDSYIYSYNKGNQRTQVTRAGENTVAYGYDAIGEVVSDKASEVSGGTARLNEQLTYAFDPAGNLAYRTNNALVERFQVNAVNELTSNTNGGTLTVVGTTTSPATSVTVNSTTAALYGDSTFAASGLTLTSTYTATGSDSYGRHSTNSVTVSIATNVTFQYDGNGNLTNDGLRNFAYDDENQLIQVFVSNAWMSQFSYDGKMRRRIRKEFTWTSGAWAETNEIHYVYDGNVVIQERDTNNSPLTTYTRGKDLSGSFEGAGGIGGLLSRSDAADANTATANCFYHSEANGNVTMLIDASNSPVAKYLYDAFGNTLSKSGIMADVNNYRFSSKEWHQNSGLAYYLYRYYDPHLQRWPNRDPILDGSSLVYVFDTRLKTLARRYSKTPFLISDPYVYADNSPCILSDPNGECPTCVELGVAVLTGVLIGSILFNQIFGHHHQPAQPPPRTPPAPPSFCPVPTEPQGPGGRGGEDGPPINFDPRDPNDPNAAPPSPGGNQPIEPPDPLGGEGTDTWGDWGEVGD
jgi:RHS repeat-associated protein